MKKIFVLSMLLATPVFAGAPPSGCSELADRLETFLSTRQITVSHAEWSWKELQEFHSFLLEAMALDPANVPTEKSPFELLPDSLNARLKEEFVKLANARQVVEAFALEEDFDNYITLVQGLLLQREQGMYTRARRVVKHGVLHDVYNRLMTQLKERAPGQMEFKVAWNQDASDELIEGMKTLSTQFKHQMLRAPAASDDVTQERLRLIQALMLILVPIVFLTGLCAGILWKRRSRYVSDGSNSEPRF